MVNFKQLLDKATNSDLSDPDWEVILEIVEEIKSKSVPMKTVMKEFRRRLLDNDSKVVYHTLLVLDSVMKNCSTDVHIEILSKEFMNVMKGIVTSSKDGGKAVDKALEMIGEWKVAFGQQSNFKPVLDVYFELEREGYHIPETQVASAAFLKKPPEFALDDRCYTCRQEFNRFKGHFRHHCRSCGKSVCAQCSGKRAPLTEFGIEEPTRVCDICYKKLDTGASSTSDTPSVSGSSNSDLPSEYLRSSLAKESQQPSSSSGEAQLQEEDDLQLAIAMSLNEQDNKDKQAPKRAPSPSLPPQITMAPSAPPPPVSTLYATIAHDSTPRSQPTPSSVPFYNGEPPEQETEEESDPNLARYLNRNYWQQRKEQQGAPPTSASAPPSSNRPTQAASASNAVGPSPVVISEGPSGSPLAESVRKTVQMFVQRLHEVTSAGGSVATDPVVLSHYQNLSALQPQLLKQIDDVQQKKAHQQAVLHKLNEAKEARVTLNRMRREHQEKIRQQEQEQSMLARMQMEQKLALLRQQKAEQFTFQQTLQQQRLDNLQSQRSEYEKAIQQQRELERQQLIAKEQQVLQHQFGSVHQPSPAPQVHLGQTYTGVDHAPLSMEPLNSMTLQSLVMNPAEQAPPLPTKVEYNPMSDPPPPPYQPSLPSTGEFLQGQRSFSPAVDGLYQSMATPPQPVSYQQPYSVAPSSLAQPQVLATSPVLSQNGPPQSLPPQQNLGPPQSLPPQQNLGPPQSLPPQQNLGPPQLLGHPQSMGPTSLPGQGYLPQQTGSQPSHPQQFTSMQPPTASGQFTGTQNFTGMQPRQPLQQYTATHLPPPTSQQYQPQHLEQHYSAPTPQGVFVPNGAHQQPTNGFGPPPPSVSAADVQPPLISFD